MTYRRPTDKEAPFIAHAAQNSVDKLQLEIMRLVRLPYASWKNQEKIRSLDKQVEYLEEVLAAYERDYKKHG